MPREKWGKKPFTPVHRADATSAAHQETDAELLERERLREAFEREALMCVAGRNWEQQTYIDLSGLTPAQKAREYQKYMEKRINEINPERAVMLYRKHLEERDSTPER